MRHVETARVPVRMCAACRRRAPKYMMVRFVASGDTLVLDGGFSASGRGVYVCPNSRCYVEAVKSKSFSRALRKRSLVVSEGLQSEFLDFVGSRFEGEEGDG